MTMNDDEKMSVVGALLRTDARDKTVLSFFFFCLIPSAFCATFLHVYECHGPLEGSRTSFYLKLRQHIIAKLIKIRGMCVANN